MFGQEPWLSNDFLLGRVGELMPREVDNWLVEHQVKVVFGNAHERLLALDERRKDHHDLAVHESTLQVGQLVYLRDHSAQGHDKIQDIWSSVLYQVKAPLRNGPVYTVAPLQRIRNVHLYQKKAHVGLKPLPSDQLWWP